VVLLGSKILLDLAGGVALLTWGLHMVHSGVVRAFGAGLRRFVGSALRNRVFAFLAGIGVTTLLQSSTATALMTTSFASGGLVELVPAMAVMLGANVGTALVVKVLSFDVSAVAPAFLVAGVVAFKRGRPTRVRDLGRVAIGLGLMLVALRALLGALGPAEQAPAMRELLQAIANDPFLCIVLAALVTWAAHSSVATVLLVMPLASSGFVTPPAALALVLGANLGSAINPLVEGGSAGDPSSRRVPAGNVATRLVGIAVAMPFLPGLTAALGRLQPDPARLVADFHLAFNVASALAFLLPLGPLGALLERLLPERAREDDPGTPAYLDERVIDEPAVALSCAARETLRIGDVVESMLDKAMAGLMTDDRKLVAEASRLDDTVDRLNEAVKLYVTRVTRESLDDDDARRALEIVAFTINLEHIGDIVDKNLSELAAKKIRQRLSFSDEGAAELGAFHRRVADDLRLAFGVFLTGDVAVARRLLEEKAALREAELAAAESHLTRLREGRPETLETTSLHLDVIRDLKRIHSHLCSVAYPVLERAGALRASRLRDHASIGAKAAPGGGPGPA